VKVDAGSGQRWSPYRIMTCSPLSGVLAHGVIFRLGYELVGVYVSTERHGASSPNER
jgi:hypothetical protein